MIEVIITFPNWGTALVVAIGTITITATMLVGVYHIGATSTRQGEPHD